MGGYLVRLVRPIAVLNAVQPTIVTGMGCVGVRPTGVVIRLARGLAPHLFGREVVVGSIAVGSVTRYRVRASSRATLDILRYRAWAAHRKIRPPKSDTPVVLLLWRVLCWDMFVPLSVPAWVRDWFRF